MPRPVCPARRPQAAPAITRVTTVETALGWMAAAWSEKRLCQLVFGYRTQAQALHALGLPGLRRTEFRIGGQTTLQRQCGNPANSEFWTAEPSPADDPFCQRLRAYADGTPDDFADVSVALDDLTEFQRTIVRQCRRIPYGQTMTYAELAAKAGRPGAARAVGSVMARNRIPLVIPCHRVVGANGSLCGFSAPGGLATKQRLLKLEGPRKLGL